MCCIHSGAFILFIYLFTLCIYVCCIHSVARLICMHPYTYMYAYIHIVLPGGTCDLHAHAHAYVICMHPYTYIYIYAYLYVVVPGSTCDLYAHTHTNCMHEYARPRHIPYACTRTQQYLVAHLIRAGVPAFITRAACVHHIGMREVRAPEAAHGRAV